MTAVGNRETMRGLAGKLKGRAAAFAGSTRGSSACGHSLVGQLSGSARADEAARVRFPCADARRVLCGPWWALRITGEV
jgi:hypothetical protein